MSISVSTSRLDRQEISFNQTFFRRSADYFQLAIKPVKVSRTATEIIIKNSSYTNSYFIFAAHVADIWKRA